MNDFSKKSDGDGYIGRRRVQNYCSADSSDSRWPPFEAARVFVRILSAVRVRVVKERRVEKWERKDDRRDAAGVLAARSRPFAFITELTASLSHQLLWSQPSSKRLRWKAFFFVYQYSEGCRICALKVRLSHFPRVAERFSHRSASSVIWSFVSSHIFHQRGQS